MADTDSELNRREITVLRYVAQGLNSHAIARLLGVKPRTIHSYFTGIREKLNSRTMEEVMFIAGRDNLLGEYYPGDEV